ncbi:MFS general substrate transporter [Hortaea werneckii]|nr:MFS general substrate transporter [Hortaea werneckii]
MSRLSQIACDVRLKKTATCDSHALENSPETPLLNDQAFDKSFLVTWTEENEQDNPRNWRPLYKCWLTFLLGMLALSASLGSSIIAPAKEEIGRQLGTGEQQTILVVSLYVLGFAFGPLLWAPISETFGRRWSLLPALFGLAITSVASASSQTAVGLFLSRFVGGVFGSAPVTNVSACLGDLFEPHARGAAVAFYAMCTVGGPTIGPVIGAAITADHRFGWRWTEYVEALCAFVVASLGLCFLPELYHPVLLARAANKKRRETGNPKYWHPHETAQLGLDAVWSRHMSLPLSLLIYEPIVMCIAAYASFVYGVLYMTLELYPFVFRDIRHLTPVMASLPFLGLFVGVLCAIGINLANQVRYAKAMVSNHNQAVPEARLPPLILGGTLFVIGLFGFGWTAAAGYHWLLPTAFGAFIGAGFNVTFQQCINFLVDTYSVHAASAVAANTFLRSLFAFALPLSARPLLARTGAGATCSILGAISCIALPIPFWFMFYSAKLRKKSRFAMVDSS